MEETHGFSKHSPVEDTAKDSAALYPFRKKRTVPAPTPISHPRAVPTHSDAHVESKRAALLSNSTSAPQQQAHRRVQQASRPVARKSVPVMESALPFDPYAYAASIVRTARGPSLDGSDTKSADMSLVQEPAPLAVAHKASPDVKAERESTARPSSLPRGGPAAALITRLESFPSYGSSPRSPTLHRRSPSPKGPPQATIRPQGSDPWGEGPSGSEALARLAFGGSSTDGDAEDVDGTVEIDTANKSNSAGSPAPLVSPTSQGESMSLWRQRQQRAHSSFESAGCPPRENRSNGTISLSGEDELCSDKPVEQQDDYQEGPGSCEPTSCVFVAPSEDALLQFVTEANFSASC